MPVYGANIAVGLSEAEAEESTPATVTTTAVTTTAPATTATPTTTATRDTITTICLWQGYVVDEIDVDYTDEDLYLEITFKLTSNENDYIYWAVGGIVPLTVEGWQDSVLTLPSYKDCKGTYRIAISELVDIITDAGYDMSDNVDIIINWWTDVNGKDENADKFTSVISMRVGTANELDSNPVEIASTISYPWTLEYTDGVEYENNGGVVENQWLIDGIVAGEQEEAGAFTLGKVAFITAKGEHMMEFIEAIQGENAYIEVVSYAPRSSHLTFNIQFNSDYNFLEFIPATDDPGDSPYIPLYTVTENDDGTITYLFSCSELLEIFEEYGYDVEEIILVSLNCEEGTVFKSFSVIQQ